MEEFSSPQYQYTRVTRRRPRVTFARYKACAEAVGGVQSRFPFSVRFTEEKDLAVTTYVEMATEADAVSGLNNARRRQTKFIAVKDENVNATLRVEREKRLFFEALFPTPSLFEREEERVPVEPAPRPLWLVALVLLLLGGFIVIWFCRVFCNKQPARWLLSLDAVRVHALQDAQHLVVDVAVRRQRVQHVQVVLLAARAACATARLLHQQASCRHVPLRLSLPFGAYRVQTQLPVARQTARGHPRQVQRGGADVADAVSENGRKNGLEGVLADGAHAAHHGLADGLHVVGGVAQETLVQRGVAADVDGLVVHECAMALDRGEHLVAVGVEDHAHGGNALRSERNMTIHTLCATQMDTTLRGRAYT